MSCDLEYSVVHSYFDGELSVILAAEFRHHLARCSDCMDEFAALSSHPLSLTFMLSQVGYLNRSILKPCPKHDYRPGPRPIRVVRNRWCFLPGHDVLGRL